MSFLCKLFYKKPPDGLLEISDRVYVFDCCFASDTWEAEEYKNYVGGVINQLEDHYPEASTLVFNFHEEGEPSQIASALAEYDITIMDYPRHYEGCPLLQMEVMHHFLQSGENWLSQGQQNVILMHCEWGGWPVLAFMLAALLIYSKQYYGEQKTLDMVYKQAPRELLHSLSPTNPMPSQVRYLQYVSRRNVVPEWPPEDRALALDCIIIRMIPDFDGEGGCRPIFRIYGHEPFKVSDKKAKLIYSTPKRSKAVRHYKQEECELAKIDINCHIQGDVVLECINLHDDMEHEQMMLRLMFNTAFIRSNIIMLDWNDIDILWDAKDQFSKDFRAEVLFSEMDAAASRVPVDLSFLEEKDGLPMEAFAKVQEIFNSVDWLGPNKDAALDVIQQITGSTNSSQEKLDVDTQKTGEPGTLLHQLVPEKHQDKQQSPRPLEDKMQSETSDRSTHVQDMSEDRTKLKSTECEAEGTLPLPESQPSSRVASTESSPSPHAPCPEKYQHLSTSEDVHASPAELPDANKKGLENAHSPVSVPRQSLEEFASKNGSHSAAPVQPPPPSAIDIGKSPVSPPSTTTHASQTPPLKDHMPGTVTSAHPLPQPSEAAFQCSNDTEDITSDQPQAPSPVKDVQPPSSSPLPPQTHTSSPVPGKNNQEIKSEHSSPLVLASAKDQTIESGGVPPPSSPPTSPLKEDSTLKGKPPPPTPLSQPPPPSSTSQDPSTPALKEDSTVKEKPPPPTPVSKPPPPPAPNSSSHDPSAPPSAVAPPPPGAENQQGPSPFPPPEADRQEGPHPPPPPGAPNQQGPPPPPPPGAATQQGPPPPPPPGAANQQGPPPPPPPGGANPQAPNPPPPCMGRGGFLSRNMNQTKKLKPLHWLKLTRAVQGSLWAETQRSADASKAPDIDMPELESLFSAAVPRSGKGGPRGKTNPRTPVVNKPEKVQLIDHRRAYNCEIMLSQVKIPLNELMKSVLALEDSAIDADQVDNLIKFCPTKEEMELLKSYKGERDKLGKCEQFFFELMQVPRAESKLRVFSFKLQFESQVSDLRNSLDAVNSTAEQIRSSGKLKKIMQTILSLGNALNQGTARGSAVGFKLETLPKLTETRARNNKMTLMHYLCKVLDEKLPEVLDFSKDLNSLESSSKIQVKFLAEEMQAINKGLEKVVHELSLSESDGPVSEKFQKVSREFLCFAEGEVRSLASLYSVVGRNIDASILYFGEDAARCTFEQVVSTLLEFVRMFNIAHEENCKQQELDKKKAEKEAASEQTKTNNSHKGAEASIVK